MKYLKPIFEDVGMDEFKSWTSQVVKDEEEILGICNGILDLCSDKNFIKCPIDNYTIIKKYSLKQGNPNRQGYGLILRFENNGFFSGGTQKLTNEYMKMFDELIEVRDRLDELGYEVYLRNTDYGMSIGIYYKKIVDLVNATKKNS